MLSLHWYNLLVNEASPQPAQCCFITAVVHYWLSVQNKINQPMKCSPVSPVVLICIRQQMWFDLVDQLSITQKRLGCSSHQHTSLSLLFLWVCLNGWRCWHWQHDWNKHIKPRWAFLSERSLWSAGWHGHSKYSWEHLAHGAKGAALCDLPVAADLQQICIFCILGF